MNDLIERFHNAAKAGDAAELNACIAAGVDVNAKDKTGRTVLHYAVMYDLLNIAQAFLAQPDCDMTIKNGDVGEVTNVTVLHLAVNHGSPEMVRVVFDHAAARDLGADFFNQLDDFGVSPFGAALVKGSVENVACLMRYEQIKWSKSIHRICAQDLMVPATKAEWLSPLVVAARDSKLNINMVQLLLEHGYYWEKKDFWLIHKAAEDGNKQLLELYLNYFTADDFNQCDQNGYKPLNYLVDEALEYGRRSSAYKLLKWFVSNEKIDPLVALDSDGNTLLHIAARERWTSIIKVLAKDPELHPYFDDENDLGETPFHSANSQKVIRLFDSLDREHDDVNIDPHRTKPDKHIHEVARDIKADMPHLSEYPDEFVIRLLGCDDEPVKERQGRDRSDSQSPQKKYVGTLDQAKLDTILPSEFLSEECNEKLRTKVPTQLERYSDNIAGCNEEIQPLTLQLQKLQKEKKKLVKRRKQLRSIVDAEKGNKASNQSKKTKRAHRKLEKILVKCDELDINIEVLESEVQQYHKQKAEFVLAQDALMRKSNFNPNEVEDPEQKEIARKIKPRKGSLGITTGGTSSLNSEEAGYRDLLRQFQPLAQTPELDVSDQIQTKLAELNEKYQKGEAINWEEYPFMLAHFRGINFNRKIFTHEERRKYILRNARIYHSTENRHSGIHTKMSYLNADIPLRTQLSAEQDQILDEIDASIRKLWVNILAKDFEIDITDWYDKKPKLPPIFSKPIYAIQHYYTNVAGKTNKAKGELRESWETIWQGINTILPQLVITPDEQALVRQLPRKASLIVSFGKTPGHSIRYAVGSSLSPVYRDSRGAPRYGPDGGAKYRALGLVYIILQTPEEYFACSPSDVPMLHKELKLSCHFNYIHETEVAFPGGVPGQQVACAYPMIFPSFKNDYDPEYQDLYGLSEHQFKLFKQEYQDLERAGDEDPSIFFSAWQPSYETKFGLSEELFECFTNYLYAIGIDDELEKMHYQELVAEVDSVFKKYNHKRSSKSKPKIETMLRAVNKYRLLKNKIRKHAVDFYSGILENIAKNLALQKGNILVFQNASGRFEIYEGHAASVRKKLVENAQTHLTAHGLKKAFAKGRMKTRLKKLITKESTAELGRQAQTYGFSCHDHDVDRDGYCFFHAVCDQLKDYPAITLVDSQDFVGRVFEYLFNNISNYCTAISRSKNTFLDGLIAKEKWADYIVVQAVADMLNINIVLIRDDGHKPTVIKKANPQTTIYLGYQVGLHFQSLRRDQEVVPQLDINAIVENTAVPNLAQAAMTFWAKQSPPVLTRSGEIRTSPEDGHDAVPRSSKRRKLLASEATGKSTLTVSSSEDESISSTSVFKPFKQQFNLYRDDDINTVVNVAIRHRLGGYMRKADGAECSFLLKGIGEQNDHPGDVDEAIRYIVAITPAVDTRSQASPLTYYLNCSTQEAPDEGRQDPRIDVFDELMPYILDREECYIKILFPYNLTSDFHWVTGEIKIHKNNHEYRIVMTAHNPYSRGEVCAENCALIGATITKRLTDYDDQAQVIECNSLPSFYQTRRQAGGDGQSCGVIVAEELIKRISGASLDLHEPYPCGAKDLRIQQACEVIEYLGQDHATCRNFLLRNKSALTGKQKELLQITPSTHKMTIEPAVTTMVSAVTTTTTSTIATPMASLDASAMDEGNREYQDPESDNESEASNDEFASEIKSQELNPLERSVGIAMVLGDGTEGILGSRKAITTKTVLTKLLASQAVTAVTSTGMYMDVDNGNNKKETTTGKDIASQTITATEEASGKRPREGEEVKTGTTIDSFGQKPQKRQKLG